MNQPLPGGVLFDLDDTLIAYDAVADESWRHVCKQFSNSSEQATSLFDAVFEQRSWYWSDPDRHHRGRHNLEAARREIVNAALASIGACNNQLADEIAQAYTVRRDESIRLFPKTIETLSFFNDRDIPLVLATNGTKERQREKIDRFGLECFFKEILIEGEQGIGKPDPIIYKKALSFLGREPSNVWSVGDNLEWDVYAPMRLGMIGVWHNYSGSQLPSGESRAPDWVVSNVSEMIPT